jgi:hypothetical protein
MRHVPGKGQSTRVKANKQRGKERGNGISEIKRRTPRLSRPAANSIALNPHPSIDPKIATLMAIALVVFAVTQLVLVCLLAGFPIATVAESLTTGHSVFKAFHVLGLP